MSLKEMLTGLFEPDDGYIPFESDEGGRSDKNDFDEKSGKSEDSEDIKNEIVTMDNDKLEELMKSDSEKLAEQISVVESIPVPEAGCDVCGNGSVHREFTMPVTHSKWSDSYMMDGGFMIYTEDRKVCLCDDCVAEILKFSGRLIETYIGRDGDKGKYGLVISKTKPAWLKNKNKEG